MAGFGVKVNFACRRLSHDVHAATTVPKIAFSLRGLSGAAHACEHAPTYGHPAAMFERHRVAVNEPFRSVTHSFIGRVFDGSGGCFQLIKSDGCGRRRQGLCPRTPKERRTGWHKTPLSRGRKGTGQSDSSGPHPYSHRTFLRCGTGKCTCSTVESQGSCSVTRCTGENEQVSTCTRVIHHKCVPTRNVRETHSRCSLAWNGKQRRIEGCKVARVRCEKHDERARVSRGECRVNDGDVMWAAARVPPWLGTSS